MKTVLPPRIDKEDIGKIGAVFCGTIVELNDKRIVVHRKLTKSQEVGFYFLFFAGVGILINLAFEKYVPMLAEKIFEAAIFLALILALIVGSFIMLLRAINSKKQYLTFDRKNKTVSHPATNWSKRHITYPFSEFKTAKVSYDSKYKTFKMNIARGTSRIGLFFVKKNRDIKDGEDFLYEYRRYIFSYMRDDTLPAGTAFDRYRNK